jgi:putative protease
MGPALPELVAPAGNPEKLRAALQYGADAVYLGLRRFSLRAGAGNFTEDELAWALSYAHERGKRVYVALNVQPFDEELDALEQTLRRLEKIGPDAVVVGDAGSLALARTAAPSLRVHLSTQLSVVNRAAASFWFGQGVRRIVLARELSVERLARLAPSVAGELEVFVHGAMCVSVSGRCFLSTWWAGSGRDPRHGTCAQPCRWPYAVTLDEAKYPGRPHELEQDERGTYFFDSRDLCALPLLDRLVKTGVHALKIEGRTRSLHYVAVVSDVYRQALDRLRDGGDWNAPELSNELARASKRRFSTHFLGGEENDVATYEPRGSPIGGQAVLAGVVTAVGDDHVDLDLRNPVRAGDVLELRAPGLQVFAATVTRPRQADGTVDDVAARGRTLRLEGRFPVPTGTLVRRGARPGEEGES